ncbi:reverse transcriptase domain-containing protein [Tanacetum coccineum]
MGPYLKSHKFEYILVAIDYVSKWAEAEALPTNDARVVVNFLKKLFSRFGILKALINDRGTHFCNRQMEKILKKYGVHHLIATTYHPQTSGQVENTNRALKRILEKTVKDNPSVWSRKLDDALWAFRTSYKTLIELVDEVWEKHYHDHLRAPTANDMEILIKTCLMPLALKTQNDSFKFVHELKQEMHADLKNVESLEKETDELESDKADFSNIMLGIRKNTLAEYMILYGADNRPPMLDKDLYDSWKSRMEL